MKELIAKLVADHGLESFRSILFSPTGEMLWISPRWLAPENTAPRMETHALGRRYREFMSDDSLKRLDRLLTTPELDHTSITFLRPGSGKFDRFILRKTQCGPLLLVLGDSFDPVASHHSRDQVHA